MVRSFQAFSVDQSAVCVHRASLTPLPTVWALSGPASAPVSVQVVRSPAPAAPCALGHPYLGQVKPGPEPLGADDQVLRKQEALPLALLQGQDPRRPGDLALPRHGHLDEGPADGDPESVPGRHCAPEPLKLHAAVMPVSMAVGQGDPGSGQQAADETALRATRWGSGAGGDERGSVPEL